MADREARRDRRGTIQAIPPFIPRKDGNLWKRMGTQKAYRERFFELDNPAQNSSRARLRGVAHLAGARIEPSQSSSNKPKITIKTSGGKKFELTAKDSVERDSWLNALVAARDAPFDEQQNRKDWSKNKDGSICLDAIGDESALQDAMSADPSYDLDDSIEGVDIFSLPIRDLYGVDCRLGDVTSSRHTLLVMCGQFGAPTTRKFLSDLTKLWEQIEDLGIQIVIVGTANPIAAGIFRKEMNLPPVLFADMDRRLYRELGCRRGFRWAFSPQAFSATQEAVSQGFRASQGAGDALQLGGLFLVSKDDGVAYHHTEKYGGHLPDLNELMSQLPHYVRKRPNIWATPQALTWNDLSSTSSSVTSKNSAFSIGDKSWHTERGASDFSQYNSSSLPFLLTDYDDMPYRRYFFGLEHTLYVSNPPKPDAEGDIDTSQGCIVASIAEMNRDKKILIFHSSGIHKRVIPAWRVAAGELQAIHGAVQRATGLNIELHKAEQSSQLQDELLTYESTQMIRNFKFGVLYAREGQTEESDIYGNTEISSAYEEFLQFLGNRVPLRGWTGYKGGLDVKKDVSGTHSILTSLDDTNIMFHVATMIPIDKDPEQALLERKRHIGNDVVVVIFKEGTQQLDPTTWRSQFNHIFVVISKDEKRSAKEDGRTYYKMEVAYKAQCPACLPVLPDPPLFEKGRDFHKFLLSKLLNAERSTTRVAPVFKQKMDKMRGLILCDCIQVFNNDSVDAKSAVLVSGRLKVRKSKSDASQSGSLSSIQTPMKASPATAVAVAHEKVVSSDSSSPREAPLSVSFAETPKTSNPPASARKEKHSRSHSRDSNSSKDAIVIQARLAADGIGKDDIFSQLEADIATLTRDPSDKVIATSSSPVLPTKNRVRGDSEKLEKAKAEERSRSESTKSTERRRPPSRSTSTDSAKEKSRIKTKDVSAAVLASTTVAALPPPLVVPEESVGATSSPKSPKEPSPSAEASSAKESALPPITPLVSSVSADSITPSQVSNLEKSLKELEEVEKQVSKAAEDRRSSNSSSSVPLSERRKNTSFAQLQAQWRNLAAQSSSSLPVFGAKRAQQQQSSTPPIVEAEAELVSVVQQVLAHINTDNNNTSAKRIVVINANDPKDKDIVPFGNVSTAAELTKMIEQTTGQRVASVSFQGVPVRDKHIRLINDKDSVEVQYA